MDGRFVDRVCVITGADSEIGAAVAARLADEGGTVIGVDRREHGVGELSLIADLADEDAVAALYGDIDARYGRLDVLYNNVGMMDRADSSIIGGDTGVWRSVQEANLDTVYLSCKHAIPLMLDRDPRGGAIVNAASFLAEIGAATAQMSFSAAKAAVVQLTRDLGIHLARSGVRVNAVLFGPIETAAQRAILERSPEILERRIVHWPMGRYGTLAEAAGAVAFLASDDAGFITAEALAVDGGIGHAFTVPDAPA